MIALGRLIYRHSAVSSMPFGNVEMHINHRRFMITAKPVCDRYQIRRLMLAVFF